MRTLFERQLAKARTQSGDVDLELLGRLVDNAYLEAEQDRLRTDRSIELMVGELNDFQAGLEAEIEKRTAQLKNSQRKLRVQNTRFAAALENMSQGIAMFDRQHRLLVCNRHYLELYGLPRRFGRPGTSLRSILEARIAANTFAGTDPASYIQERFDAVAVGKQLAVTQKLNNGRVIAVTHRPMTDGGWVTTHKDITELHSMQAELTHQAYHDALTDLPNRHLFYQRMKLAFESGRGGEGVVVLCIDLDGFKTINDTMGHSSGDRLLRHVAGRLRGCIGEGDTVARMGGDEFAVLQVGSNGDAALALAVAILDALRRPFELDDKAVSISASIGIALGPKHGETADRLLRSADMALYAAKRDGRGACRLFEVDMDIAEKERKLLERDLRQALGHGEFELHYQPIINLKSQRLAGFEALLRWRHKERGLVAPTEFIPLAEDLGLIVPIGEWVLREALSEAAGWPADLRISVNVSSAQFASNIVGTLISALAQTQIAHERVEIEITESVFLKNSQANLEALRQLHALGVRIALDDFGTGYSALSYLLSFPFDKIKIDGSFVRALFNAEAAHAIVRSVAEIGNRMGLETTAEGVETAEQLRNVNALGYTEAQGFLIAKPMPAASVHRLLNESYETMPDAPLARIAG